MGKRNCPRGVPTRPTLIETRAMPEPGSLWTSALWAKLR